MSADATFGSRIPRRQVLLGAEISGNDGSVPTKHRIKDLSVTGARVDRAEALKLGATVLVSVGALGAIAATVIWVRDGIAGLQFVEPIDPDEARSKTIIPSADRLMPKPGSVAADFRGDYGAPPVTAGWVPGMKSPYRR
jgi:hypothetical protein